MKEGFFEEIYNYATILKDEYREISSAHTKINCVKNELIVESGNICNEYYIIEKGTFRSAVNNYEGEEVTTGFFTENEILIDESSLFQRIPAVENIQAMTAGVLWKIKYEDFQELFHKIEGFREWGRSWMTSQLFISRQRSLSMITLNATQRYLKLLEEKPEVIRQVPLKYIAGFLGVTDTSLSRIRKEIAKEY
ncbi:Crp/Fnr family transcriptional regulator [Zhouia spongiae]|uniref:Crp/Fnr family transcriptional regulator n=1 Tax=Zhouia spongiae TaxID=2202721 RepID=A0ABY3YND7_9FLAO|nr:Crp/Fnr family transcriptional regulator [Zhouia spongiae]UNY99342.1 Crp/Fnr family transcriptional regulator [Zhouia spongiae]